MPSRQNAAAMYAVVVMCRESRVKMRSWDWGSRDDDDGVEEIVDPGWLARSLAELSCTRREFEAETRHKANRDLERKKQIHDLDSKRQTVKAKAAAAAAAKFTRDCDCCWLQAGVSQVVSRFPLTIEFPCQPRSSGLAPVCFDLLPNLPAAFCLNFHISPLFVICDFDSRWVRGSCDLAAGAPWRNGNFVIISGSN